MIDFDFSTKCYSCGACQSVCPQNAITMTNKLFPIVNENCVNCGLCEKICPSLNEKKYEPYISGISYVGRNKNLEIRKKSSSGGVFYLLAEYAIQQGWSVCGCVYDDDLMPKHILSNKIEDVYRMLGSKYVKSELGQALTQMKRLVKNGGKVLFSGTPCQIAGVRNLFPRNPNVACVGVVCHGSIERDIWDAYLTEESYGGKIVEVTMRDKTKGWLNYGLKFKFADGSEHVTYRKDKGYFLKAFTDGLLERDRCLTCTYKGDRIQADVLLGDAWGMDSVFPKMFDEWGLSGIICITQQGHDLFQNIMSCLDYSHVETRLLVQKNQRIVSPAPINPKCMQFRKKYKSRSCKILELCMQYEKPTIMNRLVKKMNNIVLMLKNNAKKKLFGGM